jgi:hypothetical protein
MDPFLEITSEGPRGHKSTSMVACGTPAALSANSNLSGVNTYYGRCMSNDKVAYQNIHSAS